MANRAIQPFTADLAENKDTVGDYWKDMTKTQKLSDWFQEDKHGENAKLITY